MNWKDRAVAVTEEDTGGGWKSRALPVQESGPGVSQALLEHTQDTLLGGYMPNVQGAIQTIVPDPGKGIDTDLESRGFKISQPNFNDYVGTRDAAYRRLEQETKEHPYASGAGSIGGALLGGRILSGGLGLLGKAAGIGKAASGVGRVIRAGGSAALAGGIMNPGDTEGELSGAQWGARAKNAGTGFLLGSALQGAGELVSKGVSALSPNGLDEFAEKQALKASGAQGSDLPKKSFAAQKEKIKNLGRTLLDENVDMTNPETGEAISQKLIQSGDKLEDIAKKSAALKQQAGSRIGNIYKQAQDRLKDPDFIKSLSPENFAKLKSVQINPKDMAEEIRSSLYNELGESIDGPEAIDKMNKYISRIWGKGESIELPKLLKIKAQFDSKIDYKRFGDLPETQQAYSIVRDVIRDKMNAMVSAVGDIMGDKLGKSLLDANRLYGNSSDLASIATKKLAGESARRFGTDAALGLGGAGIGAFEGRHGGVEGMVKGAAIGGALGLGSKVARNYGHSVLASGANALSKGIQGAGATPLFDAAASGAGALAGSGALGPAGGLSLPSQKLHKGLIREDNINRKLGSKK